MTAIPDLNALVNRWSGGNNGNPDNRFWMKVPRIAGAAATIPVAGRMISLWQYDGMPAGGAVPTAGEIPTRATQGALPFVPATGGREKFNLSSAVSSNVAGTFILYDRLFHIGGLSGTSTAAQTVQGSTPSPAITRNTGGAGNFAFYEVYTQLGSTSTTLTMTYTDQDGNTGQTSTINIGAGGFRDPTRAQRIPHAAGDDGLRAVASIQNTGSTGTAGNFGIVIARPLAWAAVNVAGGAGWRDWTTGLPGYAYDENACLALLFQPAAATAPEVWPLSSFLEN